MSLDDPLETPPSRRVLDLLGVSLPIIQAPMAGSAFSDMAAAVSEAGGLGSLACASLSPEQLRVEWQAIRQRTSRPINLNFFCHPRPAVDAARADRWRRRLDTYYAELGIDVDTRSTAAGREPFDAATCELVCELRPEVVSFHFGLPESDLLARVRAAGARILSSATTVAEARWLEDRGCDAIIAQGAEAGGHRGMFLTDDVATQVGTIALVPQVVDAVKVPVIAAGGLADARDDGTVITNVFTGRPARGLVNRLVREVGPLSDVAPAYPSASAAVAPLRARAEAAGSGDFSALWAGQAAPLARAMPAGELTRRLAQEAARGD